MNVLERITKPGEVIDFETVYRGIPELNPNLLQIFKAPDMALKVRLQEDTKDWGIVDGESDKPGQIVRLDYTTDVYEDGVVYPKYCNVYLPYGYDPEDKETRYNVIYFQHGNTGDPEVFSPPALKLLFDRLFALDGYEPCIVVFTTYYFDVTKDVEERKKTGSVPAGDGNWEGAKPNFWMEVTRNIIPAVELKYNTYLTNASDEAVKATRDHRLFSGYSRGCVCTWYMFHNAFEYFRYYVPMSCICTAGKGIANPGTEEEVTAYLTAPIQAHPEQPFFIYAMNGGERDVQAMNPMMRYLTKAPGFSFGRDPEKNNIYYAVTHYFHADFFAPQYFYNALPIMFR